MTDNALALAQSALSAVQSLQASVSDLSTRLASLSSQVHAQGGTVTPQGEAITGVSNTINSETSACAAAGIALASRIENWRCNTSGADAVAVSALDETRVTGSSQITSPISATEESTLEVDLGQGVEPLRLGKVTFYGESARVIRDAQAVLQSAGAGQLEVVKRANEPGEPFVVIDGQVFISDAAVETASVTPFVTESSRFSVKLLLAQAAEASRATGSNQPKPE
ncbi:hypothetical protein [Pseudomonas entomophila]|uniref:hypothetical protein n=1 Tax=Pseudomonas entomophila TaxID=312306 RepID=UPI003EC0F86B